MELLALALLQLWERIRVEQYLLTATQILYKVATVFPTPAVMQAGSPATSYTFAPGSYEYPFNFKVSYLGYISAYVSFRHSLTFD